jgi:hypothetical protein
MKSALLALIFCLAATPALACQFNTDCQPGSRCVKQGGLYGVCMGGLFPGNSNDDQPVYDSLDINRSHGNTCQFDTDCGPGSNALKGRASTAFA